MRALVLLALLLAPASSARAAREDFDHDAAEALSSRSFALAARLATLAIEENPSDARALNYRAIAEVALGRFDSAARDADAALSLAPESAAARQTRARALIGLGRYREALADVGIVLQADPSSALAYEGKAEALAGLGDDAGASAARRAAAALDSRFGPRAPVPPSEEPVERRVLGLTALALSGGLIIALAVLNIALSRRRAKVR